MTNWYYIVAVEYFEFIFRYEYITMIVSTMCYSLDKSNDDKSNDKFPRNCYQRFEIIGLHKIQENKTKDNILKKKVITCKFKLFQTWTFFNFII